MVVLMVLIMAVLLKKLYLSELIFLIILIYLREIWHIKDLVKCLN